ncbi:hypothetical protein [Streptomyces peucetius]|uniref:Uncharacterized protein n=1 Tax=Streptomyces peucetius TaxID=1950 RepID=A0ABY6I883_STRPE|nr:hypothetical protein [Streptomyces peucetius]UYQ63207.1 hypothetical protein OGH68_18175 [Streptomyces peucetius]
MGTSHSQPIIRVTFTDFLPDPDDDDCLRRAVNVAADLITFEDDHAVLWLAGVESGRYPLSDIATLAPAELRGGVRQPKDPAAVRAKYPNAYQPWSPEDEERLLAMYRDGSKDPADLAAEFGRQPSAIRRLAKLGLEHLAAGEATAEV